LCSVYPKYVLIPLKAFASIFEVSAEDNPPKRVGELIRPTKLPSFCLHYAPDPMTDDKMDFIPPEKFPESTTHNSRPVPTHTGTIISVFHLLKAAQYAVYIFGWILIPSAIFQWVLTILASSADFWFTKNVAGRLILGMRWSNKVTESGESQWVFEFVPGGISDRGAQRHTFWFLLWGGVGLWGLFSFFSLIRLSLGWLFVTGIGLSLAGSNAWGFWQCDKTTGAGMGSPAAETGGQLLPFLARAGADIIVGAPDLLASAIKPPPL
jgi:hypothetical protein